MRNVWEWEVPEAKRGKRYGIWKRELDEFLKGIVESQRDDLEEIPLTSGMTVLGPVEMVVYLEGETPASLKKETYSRVYIAEDGYPIYQRKRRRFYPLEFPHTTVRIAVRVKGKKEKPALPKSVEAAFYFLENSDPDLMEKTRRQAEEAMLSLAEILGGTEMALLAVGGRWRELRGALKNLPEEAFERFATRNQRGFLEYEGPLKRIEELFPAHNVNLSSITTSLVSQVSDYSPQEIRELLERLLEKAVREGGRVEERIYGRSYDISLSVQAQPERTIYVALKYRGLSHGHYGLVINRRGSVLLLESD